MPLVRVGDIPRLDLKAVEYRAVLCHEVSGGVRIRRRRWEDWNRVFRCDRGQDFFELAALATGQCWDPCSGRACQAPSFHARAEFVRGGRAFARDGLGYESSLEIRRRHAEAGLAPDSADSHSSLAGARRRTVRPRGTFAGSGNSRRSRAAPTLEILVRVHAQVVELVPKVGDPRPARIYAPEDAEKPDQPEHLQGQVYGRYGPVEFCAHLQYRHATRD